MLRARVHRIRNTVAGQPERVDGVDRWAGESAFGHEPRRARADLDEPAAPRGVRHRRRATRAGSSYPPGDVGPSVRRSHRMIADALDLLLEAYERHGPVFSLRLFHARHVFMLGPEANHFVLVSHARPLPLARRRVRRPDPAARRRPAHDRRRLPPPLAADHAAGVPPRADRRRARAIAAEVERAIARAGSEGARLDLYRLGARAGAAGRACARCSASTPTAGRPAWTRPPSSSARSASTAREYVLQMLRGPRTPWAAMMAARRRLDGADLRGDRAPPAQRRARGRTC